jgi:trehalose 6-phosphate phosphatase
VMLVQDATDCALFLDLDGTLIDVAPRPELVVIPPDLVTLLSRLSAGFNGAVAIVTGRPISDLNRFLAPLQPIAAGIHGAELRTVLNGEVNRIVAPMEAWVVAAVRQLCDIAPGVIVECKTYSIAVHYRLAPAAEPAIEAGLQAILANSPDHLILCPGRKVIEVVPKGIAKGAALEALLELPQFRGRRPIMIGDDVPDHSALDAAVRRGGLGLRVAGEHFPGNSADFAGPSQVRTWLAGLATRLGA